MGKDNYKKFILTMTISFVIMYGVMFMNVDSTDHIYLSLTRLYMTLLMVTPMALVMLFVMKKMYSNNRINAAISTVSIFIFLFSTVGLRRQVLVNDEQYMKAMIPHHSSAIMTSKFATIKDQELKDLSLHIIKSQEEEIAKMKNILKRIERKE